MPDFNGPQCKAQNTDRIDPQNRVIWVRATVDLSEDVVQQAKPLALYLGALASSEIYWNGERIGANGAPGNSRQTEKVGLLDVALFVPHTAVKAGDNTITLRMANFHSLIKLRSPFHYLYIAHAAPYGARHVQHYIPALLTSGAFVLAALYFGMISFGKDDEVSAVFIATMALFAGLQLFFESLRVFVPYAYPWQIWRLLAISGCAAGFSISMVVYLAKRFLPQRWRFFSSATLGLVCIAFLIPGFDYKTLFILFGASCVALGILVLPAITNAPGARATLLAVSAFFVLILIDRQSFLDRSFYLMAAILIMVLFADQARLLQRITRERHDLQIRAKALSKALAQSTKDEPKSTRLAIKTRGLTDYIETNTIARLSGADDYVELTTIGGKTFLLDDSLNALQKRLPSSFLRVHRSHIINMPHVQQLKMPARGLRMAVLKSGDEIPVSRRQAARAVKSLEIFAAPQENAL